MKYFTVQIQPRAQGGYVASIKEAKRMSDEGFGNAVLVATGTTIAAGIGDDPQQALLRAAYQWAGEN